MDPLNPTVDDLQQRFERLSPAHRIGKSLHAFIAEGNVNPDEIISLIRLEPLLATRILREANQLSSDRTESYASIEEAATAIGFQRMYDLLGLFSYPATTEREAFSYTTEAWKRAVTCAVCMENLAEKHRLDAQRAYAIGLIHSLGQSILESEPTYRKPALEKDLYGELNNRLRRFNLSGLSYALLADWGLPSSITDPIRFQYSPLDCQTTGKMACLLNLSKWITGVVREVDELPDQALGPDVLVLNLLGEGEQTLWNLVTDVSDSLQRADFVLQGKYSAC
ncbi:HDOD domain-containing protein [Pelagicoccus sp. SDUM812003]|uniref:HDOD domain-containing protein n=1 Tax=Pelagicoccus sp. SDUM812003 TaxID=3041267 RepID=UPI0028103802|nr:HDOD domain-containing protein [Pelagicoccus sp. SDUM812003]MDQ8201619.1 HDOD domain-containing protein [Pelagicoccus sp. SDUM812003]